jgi:hypothetical protein
VPRWADICSFLEYAILVESPAKLFVELILVADLLFRSAHRYTRFNGTWVDGGFEGVDILF